jgi:threonine aldolase
MREAMRKAEVGDDVYGEDPTVNMLEERAAQMLAKEAALFVPSGTMGNQICIKLHTQPGQEVILEERSHIFNYELAAMAAISGVLARPVPAERGLPSWEQIEAAIRPRGVYYLAQTGLIALENTHNMAGGTCMPVELMERICGRAHELGLPVHLDGARIFNAAIALGRDVRELARPFDSVMFCLSKGLGAPVGSMIVGSRHLIDRARSLRKMLGGGMRQAGVLAAAGLVALEKMVARLEEDHKNARLLAEGLAELPGVKVDLEAVQTNIVIFDVSGSGLSAQQLVARMSDRGVLAHAANQNQIRLVTHKDVSRADCQAALQIIRECLISE